MQGLAVGRCDSRSSCSFECQQPWSRAAKELLSYKYLCQSCIFRDRDRRCCLNKGAALLDVNALMLLGALQITIARQTPAYTTWLAILSAALFILISIVRCMDMLTGLLLGITTSMGLLIGQMEQAAPALWSKVQPALPLYACPNHCSVPWFLDVERIRKPVEP